MKRLVPLLFAGLLLTTSCDLLPTRPSSAPPPPPSEVTINQGVWGTVKYLEGDFMPPTPSGTVRRVKRRIFVHGAVTRDQVDTVTVEGWTFYTNVPTERVKTITSNQNGFFQVELPPGEYSLFVEEVVEGDTLLFANRFDGDHTIHPVTVSTDSVNRERIRINYNAAY